MATLNNNLPVRQYVKQYVKILNAVFTATKAFAGAFSPLQTLDSVQNNAAAFSVKTSATPVTINTYNKGANVAFGTGTANTNRFGNRVEIIYADTDVPYSYELSIHEGIDRFTVNNEFESAIADRLKLQSEAQVRYINLQHGAYIAANAASTVSITALTEAALIAQFDAVSKYYIDNEIIASVTAYVKPEIFNIIMNSPLTTTSKDSSISIDDNTMPKFKGFKIVETASKYFANANDMVYFAPDGIFIPFIGIETARTIESEDFDGVALQAAAKGGQFILDDNKVAVVSLTLATGG
jgi:hypothetical protein